MKRTWTEQSIREWIQRRDEYRERWRFPSLAALRDSDDPQDQRDYKSALSLERSTLLVRMHRYYTRNLAWSLEKHPIAAYPAPFSGDLFLPLSYRQFHGVRKIKIKKDDDLNYVLYGFYDERVPATYPGPNYVSSDGIIRRRHEYLGPKPFVAEYRFNEDRREIFIEWWDDYLQVKWMNDTTWSIEVYWEDCVQGWVSKLRGDYSRNLDLYEYAGVDPS
ncbi:uncharacterized protein C8Q71DRAFT_840698 [Rhodofomes roseus]|uniref:Uncharacterized protein n=1 Tax=Rhodofomes roseus TaxID=34475 RepID=A0ABQ8K6E7_9APHY|nr:uncharacterized protein C8Q71DRAFT_840698 [Rhodofomes roseus]KAH9832291.1 hypothetical protein C8Q71DRAFT_840698 [Rhodofomes roseus]